MVGAWKPEGYASAQECVKENRFLPLPTIPHPRPSPCLLPCEVVAAIARPRTIRGQEEGLPEHSSTPRWPLPAGATPWTSHETFNLLWKVHTHTHTLSLAITGLSNHCKRRPTLPPSGDKFPARQRHPCYSQEVLVIAILALLPLSHLVPKLRLASHTPGNCFTLLMPFRSCLVPCPALCFYLLAAPRPPSWTFIFDLHLVGSQLSSSRQSGLSSSHFPYAHLSNLISPLSTNHLVLVSVRGDVNTVY